jgi:hypothetical protein
MPKSVVLTLHDVAPGMRFWHGPARFEAALLGRAGLSFYAPAVSHGEWRQVSIKIDPRQIQ